jgi:NADH dehydrogenase
MVTGATGFVGRQIVRELLARRLKAICVVRSPAKLLAQHPRADESQLVALSGGLRDQDALRRAAKLSDAAIHLVGIIIARRLQGQTFTGVHLKGTQNVVDAVRAAGVKRFVHMSALGARPDAVSRYHKTKWMAEQCVVNSGLDWTIFRPSLIHGPGGEFIRLLRRLMCGSVPPVIPYFGNGRARVQPVYVKDVAHCFVESLLRDDTIRNMFPLGGPRAYTWIELYNACRAVMPRAKHWKPLVSLPVPLAKLAAISSAAPMAVAELIAPSIGMFRFDCGQVQMSQEDNICDHTLTEQAFGITMRSFEAELAAYVRTAE